MLCRHFDPQMTRLPPPQAKHSTRLHLDLQDTSECDTTVRSPTTMFFAGKRRKRGQATFCLQWASGIRPTAGRKTLQSEEEARSGAEALFASPDGPTGEHFAGKPWDDCDPKQQVDAQSLL